MGKNEVLIGCGMGPGLEFPTETCTSRSLLRLFETEYYLVSLVVQYSKWGFIVWKQAHSIKELERYVVKYLEFGCCYKFMFTKCAAK